LGRFIASVWIATEVPRYDVMMILWLILHEIMSWICFFPICKNQHTFYLHHLFTFDGALPYLFSSYIELIYFSSRGARCLFYHCVNNFILAHHSSFVLPAITPNPLVLCELAFVPPLFCYYQPQILSQGSHQT
jgi:hypothetical protein